MPDIRAESAGMMIHVNMKKEQKESYDKMRTSSLILNILDASRSNKIVDMECTIGPHENSDKCWNFLGLSSKGEKGEENNEANWPRT